MRKINITLGITIIILFSVIFFSRHAHNRFIDDAHLVHVAYGRVETEIKRKHVVETRSRNAVKQYANIEGEIVRRLATLNGLIRAHASEARQQEIKGELLALIRKLDILREAYPELKVKRPYIYLMEILKDAGQRVTRERLRYNEAAYEFNMMLHIFPYRVISWLMGLDREPFFRAADEAKGVPAVRALLDRKVGG